MNLYIKKLSFLLLSLAFIFSACENEETLVITSPDPALTLQEPGISTVFLNFGTPDNAAITLSWNDDLTNSTSYTVEMALESEFVSPISVGTAEGNSFTMSVEQLNEAIRTAGVVTYVDIATYFRVSASSTLSNGVQYLVTTYPNEVPVISSPAANDAFVLLLDMADETAMTINWSDVVLESVDLTSDVNYTVEAAASGTEFASPVTIGTAMNAETVSSTHADLNAVAIGIGLVADTVGDMDIRVVATNVNSNGNILERISETLTVVVTPYNVSFPNLFLVGDATTPGWNPDNNNTVVFRNQDIPNAYFFTGYFGAGAFKMLETKDWHPQWGTNDGSSLSVSNLDGSNEPGTFNVATAGYYTYNFTTVGDAGSFTVTPYDASAAPEYPTIGVIGDSTPGGWGDDTDMTQDPNNPHLWFINGISLTANQLKFRANNDWADNWGDNGSSQLYGTSIYNSPDNFAIAEAGTYDIWFNDLDGSYIMIKE